MTSDPRYDIQPRPTQEADTSSIQPSSRSIDIRRPPARPLPQNRPVGDNTTESMDDMLGYLD